MRDLCRPLYLEDDAPIVVSAVASAPYTPPPFRDLVVRSRSGGYVPPEPGGKVTIAPTLKVRGRTEPPKRAPLPSRDQERVARAKQNARARGGKA